MSMQGMFLLDRGGSCYARRIIHTRDTDIRPTRCENTTFLLPSHPLRFLTTLERHFKNISQGSFSVTLDTLPSMMNAIRMVWVISRHYNTDERMVPLMELVAGEIAGKVRRASSPCRCRVDLKHRLLVLIVSSYDRTC